MSDASVVAAVDYPPRRSRYIKARWSLMDVNLIQCHVWPQMGGRPWATGTVNALLPIFRQQEPKDSRIWAMVSQAALFVDHLEILIIREAGVLKIDDGSHRAIAMALGGLRVTRAYVGSL